MKPRIDPANFPELTQVLTLAQAVREYPITKTPLLLAIDRQRVAAVRIGGSVLIARRSLESYLQPK